MVNVNAQQWLDEWYPEKKRSEIKGLHLEDKNLEGELDLSDFVNLEELICHDNEITGIRLPSTAEKKLKILVLENNNFNQDLSFLSHLVGLKRLNLGNNRFYGSLEFLKDMSELENLDISDTDLDDGLEYLPKNSIKEFNCSASKRKDAKVQAIYNLVTNDQEIAGTEEKYGQIKNFSQKSQKLQEEIIAQKNMHDNSIIRSSQIWKLNYEELKKTYSKKTEETEELKKQVKELEQQFEEMKIFLKDYFEIIKGEVDDFKEIDKSDDLHVSPERKGIFGEKIAESEEKIMKWEKLISVDNERKLNNLLAEAEKIQKEENLHFTETGEIIRQKKNNLEKLNEVIEKLGRFKENITDDKMRKKVLDLEKDLKEKISQQLQAQTQQNTSGNFFSSNANAIKKLFKN